MEKLIPNNNTKYQLLLFIDSRIASLLNIPLKKLIPHNENKEQINCKRIKPSTEPTEFHLRQFC